MLVWEAHEVLSESIVDMNITGLQTYENGKVLYGCWECVQEASTAASSSLCLKCETTPLQNPSSDIS